MIFHNFLIIKYDNSSNSSRKNIYFYREKKYKLKNKMNLLSDGGRKTLEIESSFYFLKNYHIRTQIYFLDCVKFYYN